MSFFDNRNFKNFVSQPIVAKWLKKNDCVLFSMENIHELIGGRKLRSGRIVKNFSSILPSHSTINHQIDTNRTVNAKYVKNSLKKLQLKPTKHDFLILAKNTNKKQYSHFTDDGKHFDVIAFMIVEKGECKSKPNVPALKLIFGTGEILLYAYIYFLKAHSIKEGILEVAGSYRNIRAVCAYNKFGFREDFEMKKMHCFHEYSNLPMKVNVDDMCKNNFKKLNVALNSKEQPSALSEMLNADRSSEPLCNKDFLTDNRSKRHQNRLISEKYLASNEGRENYKYDKKEDAEILKGDPKHISDEMRNIKQNLKNIHDKSVLLLKTLKSVSLSNKQQTRKKQNLKKK